MLVAAAALCAAVGCHRSPPAGPAGMIIDEVPRENWEALAAARVYFGHQSVGFNIVEGLGEVLRERSQIRLNLASSPLARQQPGPVFLHETCGVNGKPATKLEAFSDVVREGDGEPFDVAFFKFCYVDLAEGTPVEQLFAEYRAAMTKLETEHPETTFMHTTVPLTVVQRGPKAWVKRLLGRAAGGYADNAARCRYNALLRREYAATKAFFDLAAVESTHPDGRRELFTFHGEVCEALVPAYASDGRHLSAVGAKRAAEQLLVSLAAAVGGRGRR